MGELTYINNLIDKRYDTYEVLKRKYGIVKEVVNESKAIVTLEDKDMSAWQKEYKRRAKEKKEAEERGEEPPVYNNDGTRDLTLINATGENLAGGDSVWVYYWHDLASGYIALRNGLSDNAIEMPPLNIGKLGVYSSEQADLYMPPHTYYGDSFISNFESRLVNVDEQNGIEIHQGEGTYGFNTFFVNGYPCVIIPNGLSGAELRQYIISVNPDLFSREFNLKTYRELSGGGVAINPDIDTNISIALMNIDSISGNQGVEKRYQFGSCASYKDIEFMYRILDTNLSEIMFFDSMQIDDKNVGMVLGFYSSIFRIYAPSTLFPNGSIQIQLFVRYNETSQSIQVGTVENLLAGFQSIEEYEFALCMIRSYSVIQSVVESG